MERRVLTFQFRANKRSNGAMNVAGYAARYNTLSHPISDGVGGKFRERIAKGAFKKILGSKPDCVALLNHDANKPLGRTTARTLELNEDDNGLKFSCDLPNTSYGKDLYESVQRGDMYACSFAFNLEDEDQSFDEEADPESRSKVLIRTIKNFRALYDISIVTNPAYPGTSVGATRSLEMRSLPTTSYWLDSLKQASTALATINHSDVVARRKALLNAIL
jgi:HK97 family phage prohead protease